MSVGGREKGWAGDETHSDGKKVANKGTRKIERGMSMRHVHKNGRNWGKSQLSLGGKEGRETVRRSEAKEKESGRRMTDREQAKTVAGQ